MGKAFLLAVFNLFTFQSIQIQNLRGCHNLGVTGPDHTAHSKHGQITPVQAQRIPLETLPATTGPGESPRESCLKTAHQALDFVRELHQLAPLLGKYCTFFLPPLLVEDCLWYACREYAPHLRWSVAEDMAVVSCHSWNCQIPEKQSSSERAKLWKSGFV